MIRKLSTITNNLFLIYRCCVVSPYHALLHYTFGIYFALRLWVGGWPILSHSLHILHSISFTQITPPNLSLVRNVWEQIASFSYAIVSTVKQQWYFYRFSKQGGNLARTVCSYESQERPVKKKSLSIPQPDQRLKKAKFNSLLPCLVSVYSVQLLLG